MQQVDEKPIETIHLYVVRGEERRPYAVFPLFCALLCLLGIAAITLYSAQHPYYEHERITVPAKFLSLKVFEAEAPIIPTGVKTYPATSAHGILTITNGSVVSQQLPAGLIFNSKGGIEVVTDSSVFVPAGNAEGFGMSTVPAHLLTSGINMSTLSVDQVVGTSLYIRNLSPFTGGKLAYTVTIQLPKDKEAAINVARTLVASQKAQVLAFLAKPCKETIHLSQPLIQLSWGCQFAFYHVPSYMHVLAARLSDKDFLVDVAFTPRPQRLWTK